tara:strand:- start:421 stop:675 length:255 start_codon:yes stop_codon:yes gene_type:complete
MKTNRTDNIITRQQLKRIREKIPESKYSDINNKLLKDRKKQYDKEIIRSVLNGEQINNDILIAALEVSIEITQMNIKKLRSQKF